MLPLWTMIIQNKRLLSVYIAVFILGLSTGMSSYLLGPVTQEEVAPTVITIPPRATTTEIAALLVDADLIKSGRAFIWYAQFTGLDAELRAGEYELSPNFRVPEIARLIARGQTRFVDLTIPEGLNTDQIGKLLADKGLIAATDFDQALAEIVAQHDYSYTLPDGQRSLEGYLFPDTYMLTPQTSATEIILLMLENFEQKIEAKQIPVLAEDAGMSLHEAVTLASLVEKEAKIPEERATISGVLHNRLRANMLLQVDATVIYALGDYDKDIVYYTDLEVDSPFNTYRESGLPPGPIANPGGASLEAAVMPAEHKYYYYVARPDGSHAFSETFAQHEVYVERYIP